MFNQDFYFSTIRKYVTLFGTLFSEINIQRANSSNTVYQYIKVPLTYAQGEKMLTQVEMAIDEDRPSLGLTLPVMSFEITSLQYDGNRKLTSTGRSAYLNSSIASQFKYQYNPVPYDVGFQLSIWTKNVEDGNKIVEQILPYFTPSFTVSAYMIPELDVKVDIPVILNSVNQHDPYAEKIKENQPIIWTLDFTIKGFFWGPVKNAPVILFANTNFKVPEDFESGIGNTVTAIWTSVFPGQDANGVATTDLSITVPANTIFANSDYGYIEVRGIELGDPIMVRADDTDILADRTTMTADTIAIHQ